MFLAFNIMCVNLRDVTAFRTHAFQPPPFSAICPKERTKLVPRGGSRSRDRYLEGEASLRKGVLFMLILRKEKPKLLWTAV